MKKNFKETSKAGAAAWLFQRISAVILFIILLFHFLIYHFLNDGTPTWSEAAANMKSPWFNLVQFLFLVTALYHGLNGVWMVIEDYIHSRSWRLFLFGIILILGLGLFFIGTLTIFKVANLEPGV